MYVCVCNAVTEDDVHGCMASGCTTAKDIKAACGFKPGCGSCTKRIHAMVSQYRTASELADALTGGPLPLSAVPEIPEVPGRAIPGRAIPGPAIPGPAVPRPALAETAEEGSAPQTAA